MNAELAQRVLAEAAKRRRQLELVKEALKGAPYEVTGYPMDRCRREELITLVGERLGLMPRNSNLQHAVRVALESMGVVTVTVKGRRMYRGIRRLPATPTLPPE